MIVMITFKCRPDSSTDEAFVEHFNDFRETIKGAIERGGFGPPARIEARYLIESASGNEVTVA